MLKKSTIERIISDDLSRIWILLTPEERRLVVDNFHIYTFKKGQIIYEENETPENLWCILKGKVKMYKDGVAKQQILRMYRPVQYFGYRAYFANELYVSSVAAVEESQLGAIKMDIVRDLINQNKQVAWFFIHELSRHLGGSDTRIVNLTQKHTRGRLAEALAMLLDSYGYEEDGETLQVYMSREDLANFSNMTTANAIRTLSSLAEDKIIIVDGRRIKILDEKMLRRISKFG